MKKKLFSAFSAKKKLISIFMSGINIDPAIPATVKYIIKNLLSHKSKIALYPTIDAKLNINSLLKNLEIENYINKNLISKLKLDNYTKSGLWEQIPHSFKGTYFSFNERTMMTIDMHDNLYQEFSDLGKHVNASPESLIFDTVRRIANASNAYQTKSLLEIVQKDNIIFKAIGELSSEYLSTHDPRVAQQKQLQVIKNLLKEIDKAHNFSDKVIAISEVDMVNISSISASFAKAMQLKSNNNTEFKILPIMIHSKESREDFFECKNKENHELLNTQAEQSCLDILASPTITYNSVCSPELDKLIGEITKYMED